jgi:predicted pyridoxine 5'-phosphate oxidase superfamily flavin-nucleotide-binding protein
MVQLTQEMKDFIARPDVGKVLATISADGYPNIGPKGTIRVFDDGSLAYLEMIGKHHFQNLKSNPRAAIACIDFGGRQGYRFVGDAELHESGEVFDKLTEPFPADKKPKAVVVLKVEHVFGLGGAQVGEQIL